MSIEIQRSVIQDPSGRIKFRKFRSGGKEHYHLGVWIDADDRTLDSIERVEYELHPSFKRRLRYSENRDNKFSVTFWTYGMFDMTVNVIYKNGKKKSLPYSLTYELPADDGTNYVDLSNL